MSASRLVLLLCSFAAFAHAELALDVPAIEVKPKPEDEEVETTFTFRNKGDKPVKILGLESACSCLSAELDKAEYQPGETGTGRASFKVSTFVGRHEKHIMVSTDDPKQAEWQVDFILDVPAVVDIKPKQLQWFIGDEPTQKSCLVQFTGDEPTKIIKITPTRENVEFDWKEVKEGREYLITVKPKSTQDVTMGALKIETSSSIAKYRYQLAFFSISRKPEPQPASAAVTKP
ncbi:MAG: DUF1573 domain-containing protein [Prosthecobacter sp.]|jgi:hypothetical protein|uniref:DUF1573 domain-containing protein n=1 Tax=Prosthecobacter sp. TaxID=1965333 RepID=UPI0019F5FA15|nr:DUF1573 domain-containing protein [Prosthecobacter sp.]MBE2287436.1 DUF1573 domain-containing protein [Prosthecobacter sp.]